jgi:hypothetical protein
MLQNTPKQHFWSNGVEWMYLVQNNFRNSGTLKYTPETQVLHLLHCENFRNAPKHTQTPSWV